MPAHANRPHPARLALMQGNAAPPLPVPGNPDAAAAANAVVAQANIVVPEAYIHMVDDLYHKLGDMAERVNVVIATQQQLKAMGYSSQNWPMGDGLCPPIGAPNPCRPLMHPNQPDKIYGAPIPLSKCGCENLEQAVKRMCWVEYPFRSITPVDAGETILFTIQVKWWWQPQKIINLGDQVTRTFDLIEIGYGQSNYSLTVEKYQIDGVDVAPNGIDVRRWNQTSFVDKNYPFPATALNDDLDLTWLNVAGGVEDVEFVMGGPAVLQIG